jgi:hypothetical protein
MTKKLQENSILDAADLDGDGIITDEELAKHERMIQIENNDRMEDQQRAMAWVSMLACIFVVFILLTPYVSVDRMDSISGFLNTFLVAQTGIVVGFMGATAWSKRKQ